MREINKIFCSSLFFILLTFSVKAENKVLIMGSADAKINVKVFSSLTCPHCANFHKNIFERTVSYFELRIIICMNRAAHAFKDK